MEPNMPDQPAHHAHAIPHEPHVVPISILAAVWIALVVLTGCTVAITWFDLGRLNLWAALVIATAKASLVVLYFMHLRYERPFNAIVFISALVFVALLVGGTLTDTREYQPDLIPGYAPAMNR